jgi:SOS-response transcriptional repressor LexA
MPEPVCECGHGKKAHAKGYCKQKYLDGCTAFRETLAVSPMDAATTTVKVAGEIGQGVALLASVESITLPTATFEDHERVYRATDASLAEFDVSEGDLLIVEPKRKADTGEFVIAVIADQIFVGHWWAKRGRRDVMAADGQQVIVRGATVIGAINLIVRSVHGR